MSRRCASDGSENTCESEDDVNTHDSTQYQVKRKPSMPELSLVSPSSSTPEKPQHDEEDDEDDNAQQEHAIEADDDAMPTSTDLNAGVRCDDSKQAAPVNITSLASTSAVISTSTSTPAPNGYKTASLRTAGDAIHTYKIRAIYGTGAHDEEKHVNTSSPPVLLDTASHTGQLHALNKGALSRDQLSKGNAA